MLSIESKIVRVETLEAELAVKILRMAFSHIAGRSAT